MRRNFVRGGDTECVTTSLDKRQQNQCMEDRLETKGEEEEKGCSTSCADQMRQHNNNAHKIKS
jgi:hypothetical protein